PQGAASTVVGPQGAQGATGPQGQTGPQGATGADGPSGPLVRKAADQNVFNSTTLVDDSAPPLALSNTQSWGFEAFLLASCDTGNRDIKITFTAPANSTITWVSSSQITTSATVNDFTPVTASGTVIVPSLVANTPYVIRARGFVTTTNTSG